MFLFQLVKSLYEQDGRCKKLQTAGLVCIILSTGGACRYSFGTAVQVLPIPELMPFRLTRQMVGVLQPHDALAMLQAPCTLAMTALRSGRDILQVEHMLLDSTNDQPNDVHVSCCQQAYRSVTVFACKCNHCCMVMTLHDLSHCSYNTARPVMLM